MKILISILINSLILFAIAYFLWENSIKWLETWIQLGCWECMYNSIPAIKIYLLWWIVLGLINLIVRPVLQILSIPLFFIFFPVVVFVINWIVLFLLDYILTDLLIIEWIWYHINWKIEFVIAVVIFTILNTIYSLLFFKK